MTSAYIRPACTCSEHQLVQVGCDCAADPFYWNSDGTPCLTDADPRLDAMKRSFHRNRSAGEGKSLSPARYVPVESCDNCGSKGHKGGFGNPRYIPVCRRMNRELGYTVVSIAGLPGASASYDGVIPDWCPLPKLENSRA